MSEQQILIWTMTFIILVACWMLYVVAKRVIRWFNERQEGDWSFGEFGIIKRQDDGSYRAMDMNDLMELECQTEAALAEWWRLVVIDAYGKHGPGIMRWH